MQKQLRISVMTSRLGKKTGSRSSSLLSFSAGKIIYYPKKLMKGGTEQFETTEKPYIFKHHMHYHCCSNFLCAFAAFL
jgi:hypothetical protein